MSKKELVFLLIIAFISFFSIGNHIFTINSDNNTYQTLILDAGHGGLDGGAVSPNNITESDITLNISEKSATICSFVGIPYTQTRTTQESLDFNENVSIKENKVNDTKARVSIVNDIKNGYLASIHLNMYTDSTPHGAQIFYNNDAKDFANSLQETINTTLDSTNTRVAQDYPNTVYLIKNANCPAIIFECGFLSNENDEALLINDDYHTKLALTLVSTYNNYIKGLQNETKNNISLQ